MSLEVARKVLAPMIMSSGAGHQSVELFSGCGGLAMGLSVAGFRHRVLVERDTHACATIEHNKAKRAQFVEHWTVRSSDVRTIDWRPLGSSLDLVAGGPPCQPFSVGGLAAGDEDARDMWPEAVRAVREMRPRAFVFENVRGLLRARFSEYVEWVRRSLTNPDLERRPQESVWPRQKLG
jgi:DNA (cytosine-5)-methyltransferase 1